ncbi:DUF4439 domain-containing protein [Aeromicrobium choanae]|uniref:DUF4439 domain-containing protein n=1 Tax=Aeromicrobium choanae TaxID=1736691 RepID=A0A1T4YP60_9ACTN|nr:DUF4439 domain-containing protein [Aeromicrobium choanae]SKB03358.1 protein of unknown function [Aeromicrobium choanae]
MSTATELRLTQRWLALEHEAIWTLGLVGARVPALADAAEDALATHSTTRDRLSDAVRKLGGSPVATQPSYDVAEPTNAATGRTLVRDVESRIAAACVRLVAATTDQARDRAVRGLRAAAVAEVRWGGEPDPFPGLD